MSLEMPEGWKKLKDCAEKPLRHYGIGYMKEDVDLSEAAELMKEMAEALEEEVSNSEYPAPQFDSEGNILPIVLHTKSSLALKKFKEWK